MNLRRKILISSVSLVMVSAIGISLLAWNSMKEIRDEVVTIGKDLETAVEETSSSTLTEEIKDHLMDVAVQNANIYDNRFREISARTSLVAESTTKIFSNSSSYSRIPVNIPDKNLEGEVSAQLIYSERTDLNSPAVKEEIGLLGNMSEILNQLVLKSEDVASTQIATESGLVVVSDNAPASKLDENGNVSTMEATKREWYEGAKEVEGIYFTSVTKDVYSDDYGIVCGAPFYKNGEFAGVASTGLYLNDMVESVRNMTILKSGYACVVNNEGEIIISSSDEGELSVKTVDNIDVRKSVNESLSGFMKSAMKGNQMHEALTIDGERHYVAAAPMETVGWVFVTVVPESIVNEPTKLLSTKLQENSDSSLEYSNSLINLTIIRIIIVGIIVSLLSIFVVVYLSGRIVRPLRYLTESVNQITGDNLDFKWELKADVETETLGKAFETLTVKLQEYIVNLTEVTAEKERIGAELQVASQIQIEMMPDAKAVVSDIPGIEISGSMDPAKEVGGDFYDVFKIDERHLGLVIADVSGKGVPAALFMVISKTLVKLQSLSGDYKSPAKILMEVNNQLCEGNDSSLFCTCWLGIMDIETGKTVCANAGHEYPAIRGRGGDFEIFKDDPHGIALAALEDMPYTDYEITLEEGGTLFVYTDGVMEATDKDNNLFGTERFLSAINVGPDETPDKVIENVTKGINDFVKEADQFDDITMLCVKYKG